MRAKIVGELEELVEQPVEKDTRVEFINTGSTLLNLAASQRGKSGGWARGRIVNIVGDGSSGKTLLALEACANAFYNIKKIKSNIYPEVKSVQIVYNNVEGVMDFPIEDMYGQAFNDGVEWIQTSIAEEFGTDYQKRVRDLKDGQFLLYVIDSIDALVPQVQADRMATILDGRSPDGSYGTEKAKFFSSSFFGHLCDKMKGKDATLICISQVREKIGVLFGERHYRTGGMALNFYTHQVCWLAHTGKLEKTFRTQKRAYGITIKGTFKRSKVAKPFRTADFAILFDYGIDDISSMIDYYYGTKDKKIEWNGQELKRSELIALLDENKEQYEQLQDIVEKEWLEIEEGIKPKRKPRFQ